MKRYLFAAVLLAAVGTHAVAQTPPSVVLPSPTPMVGPPLPAFPTPVAAPSVGIGGTAYPMPFVPNGYHVSGGQLIGANGSYPFDTGMYLLGGTDTARVTGYYRMVPSATPGGPPATVPGSGYGTGRAGCGCRW